MGSKVVPFVAKGHVIDMMLAKEKRILFDGARGTGKSRPVSRKIILLARTYQGSRWMIMRKTRVSMTETTLVTFEKELEELFPAALTGCGRDSVRHYRIGKSEVVAQGWEDESRARSGEYCGIWYDEAHELTREVLESTAGSLRWPVGPSWRQQILTTNPDSDKHWLWQMHLRNELRRIRSRHEDNPSVTEDYLDTLRSSTGVRYKRFYLGEWCQAEGQFLDCWNDEENTVTVRRTPDGREDWGSLSISWYGAAVDWGHRNAGVICVFGVSVDGTVYEVAQVYRTGWTPTQWIEAMVELDREFKLQAIVCDPSNPGMIEDFNIRLGYEPKAPDAICFGADNKRGSMAENDLAGLNLLYEMVRDRKFKVVRDNLRMGRDQKLLDAARPTCSLEEVGSCVWERTKDGQPIRERIDKTCDTHGMDCWRYFLMYQRYRDMSPVRRLDKDEPDTYGALYQHSRVMEALRIQQEDGIDFDEAYALLEDH